MHVCMQNIEKKNMYSYTYTVHIYRNRHNAGKPRERKLRQETILKQFFSNIILSGCPLVLFWKIFIINQEKYLKNCTKVCQ